jgi:hypothetical protein
MSGFGSGNGMAVLCDLWKDFVASATYLKSV